jgi:hypothetical protein
LIWFGFSAFENAILKMSDVEWKVWSMSTKYFFSFVHDWLCFVFEITKRGVCVCIIYWQTIWIDMEVKGNLHIALGKSIEQIHGSHAYVHSSVLFFSLLLLLVGVQSSYPSILWITFTSFQFIWSVFFLYYFVCRHHVHQLDQSPIELQKYDLRHTISVFRCGQWYPGRIDPLEGFTMSQPGLNLSSSLTCTKHTHIKLTHSFITLIHSLVPFDLFDSNLREQDWREQRIL